MNSKANIKLIVADMDGTLLNDRKQMPTDFWEVEQQLADQNILFAVASGRQFYNLLEVFDAVKDRILFIAENGSYVLYKGKQLYSHPLGRNSVNELIVIGRKIKESYTIVSGLNSAYIEKTDDRFLDILYQHYNRVAIVDDLTLVEDEVLKVTICDFKIAEKNSYTYFKHLEKDYRIAVSGNSWLDINHIHCNKGIAVEMVQDCFEIAFDETAVFGDFLNDLEMMQTAKYSYAMKNAHSEIIKISNFSTAFDNNNDGVTKTIRALVL